MKHILKTTRRETSSASYSSAERAKMHYETCCFVTCGLKLVSRNSKYGRVFMSIADSSVSSLEMVALYVSCVQKIRMSCVYMCVCLVRPFFLLASLLVGGRERAATLFRFVPNHIFIDDSKGFFQKSMQKPTTISVVYRAR